MRYYEDFFQPDPLADKCPFCKSTTCQNSPTVRERERSRVLQISREKLAAESLRNMALNNSKENTRNECRTSGKGLSEDKENNALKGGGGTSGSASLGLRKKVAVKNTVKRLEDQINKEIMESFAMPVRMG